MLKMLKMRQFYTFLGEKEKSFSLVKTLKDGSKFFEQEIPSPTQILPPRVREFVPRQKLNQDQIEEMKSLRLQDPDVHTVKQLAKRYGVLPSFVLKHTICPIERKLKIQKEQADQFQALPLSKKVRQIDRIRRKALW
jgi:hypothetical protein